MIVVFYYDTGMDIVTYYAKKSGVLNYELIDSVIVPLIYGSSRLFRCSCSVLRDGKNK